MAVLSHLPLLARFQEISSILKELRRVQKQLEGGCGQTRAGGGGGDPH